MSAADDDARGAARPERPIEADWLALRRPADERARAASAPLVDSLAAHVRESGYDGGTAVHVVDLGAGTGANRAYLAPRLPFATRWTLLDHDPALLADTGNEGATRVAGGLEALPGLLGSGPQLVTCSALLDLLTPAELEDLARLLVAASAPALLALSVDGAWSADPGDADDHLVAAAFDDHQRRGGRPGPGAAAHLARSARQAGARVAAASTPWRLGEVAADAPLLQRYLRDRADAALEQLPAGDPDVRRVQQWADRRAAQARAGELRVTVGHTDLLILPPA